MVTNSPCLYRTFPAPSFTATPRDNFLYRTPGERSLLTSKGERGRTHDKKRLGKGKPDEGIKDGW